MIKKVIKKIIKEHGHTNLHDTTLKACITGIRFVRGSETCRVRNVARGNTAFIA